MDFTHSTKSIILLQRLLRILRHLDFVIILTLLIVKVKITSAEILKPHVISKARRV